MQAPGTPYSLEVNPNTAGSLARLEDLAGNLWYSWDRPTRELFERLHESLWNASAATPERFSGESTNVDWFTRRRSGFLSASSARFPLMTAIFSRRAPRGPQALQGDDLVAYFCASSDSTKPSHLFRRPRILAGTHCKRPATSACRWSESACSTVKAIFPRPFDDDGNQGATYADSELLGASGDWSRLTAAPI